jgi:hypothetical protein
MGEHDLFVFLIFTLIANTFGLAIGEFKRINKITKLLLAFVLSLTTIYFVFLIGI